jgi:hypothetical protein
MAQAQQGQSFRANFFDRGLSQRSFEQRDVLLATVYDTFESTFSNSDRLEAIENDGRRFARTDPFAVMRMWLIGCTRLLLNGAWTKYLPGQLASYTWHSIFAVINTCILVLGLLGLRRLGLSGEWRFVSVLTVVLLYMALMSAPAANPRLRASFFPLAYLPAAMEILQLRQRMASRRSSV